jgi:protein arginine phosphatase
MWNLLKLLYNGEIRYKYGLVGGSKKVNILFVCTGNTCRSPMAEAILKNKNLPNVEVKSAGVYAIDGQHASGHVKTVLAEKQIQHEHRSRLLTEQDVEWATYILSMTSSHREAILQYFPSAVGKVFTIKDFAGEGEHDVIDPFGGNVEIYQKTFQDLENTVDKVIGRFKK